MTRRRKRILAASAAAAAVLGAAGVARMLAAGRVLAALRDDVLDRYGLEARSDDVSLSVLDGTASFSGFRLVDGPVTVLEAERIEVEGRVLDLLAGRLDVARLRLHRPCLHVYVEPGGRTNLHRILSSAPGRGGPGPGGVLLLREGTVEDGRVEYTDAILDPALPLRITLHRIRGSVTRWRTSADPEGAFASDIRVDGEIEQPGFPARVSVVAWSAPAGGPPAWTLQAAVTGFDLRGVPQYVGAGDRAALGSDLLHLAVDVRTRGRDLGPGTLVGEVPATGSLLTTGVGGTVDDPVFDEEGALSVLLRIPLSRAGRLGAVALGAGWSVVRGGAGAVADVGGGVAGAVGSLGTGLADAGGAVLAGDPLGVLEGAGEGVLGVFTSIGGGLLDGAASLLGGGTGAVDLLAGADAAELDRRFAELHAARRLAMLRAALAAPGGAGAAARSRRIEAEIGDPQGGP